MMIKRIGSIAALICLAASLSFGQFSGSGIRVTERDTAQTLPAGLWGVRVTTSAGVDTLTIEHNTATSGNFGTLGTVLQAKGGVVSFPDYSVTLGTVTSGLWNATKIGLAYGGTNADLSATGGTSRVLQQVSSGAAITVARLACADLSDSGTGCTGAAGITGSGTSGQVTFFNGTSTVTSDADLTFATDTLTATKFVGSTSITDSGLTSGRVTFAGASGLLSDDSDFTFLTDTATITKVKATTALAVGGAAIGATATATLGTGGAGGSLILAGSTSGSATVACSATCGTPTITFGSTSGTPAMVGDSLQQFASTTSAQLASVISNETGSGALAFATSPTLVTPDFTTGFTIGGTATTSKFVARGNGTRFVAAQLACADLSDAGAGCTGGAGTFTGSVTAGQIVVANQNNVLGSTASVGAASGGTGQTTYAVGDILYASATTTLSKLADVAAGAYLRSGGVTTAPLWSTLILPNAITANQIVYGSATNTYGASSSLTFDGTILTVGGTAFGGSQKMTIVGDQVNYAGSPGAAQLVINGATTAGKMLQLGFDTTNNVGYIRAVQDSVGEKAFYIQGNGGDTHIGGKLYGDGITNANAQDYACYNTGTKEIEQNVTTCNLSSERFKHNITDIQFNTGVQTDPLNTFQPSLKTLALVAKDVEINVDVYPASSLLNKMHPVNFYYNRDVSASDLNHTMQQFGFIAEEVLLVDPRLVTFEADGITPHSARYLSFIPILTNGFQEHDARIVALEREISSLKMQLGVK